MYILLTGCVPNLLTHYCYPLLRRTAMAWFRTRMLVVVFMACDYVAWRHCNSKWFGFETWDASPFEHELFPQFEQFDYSPFSVVLVVDSFFKKLVDHDAHFELANGVTFLIFIYACATNTEIRTTKQFELRHLFIIFLFVFWLFFS